MEPIKIVCLIQQHAPLLNFANKINQCAPLALVIVENPGKAKGLFAKICRHGIKRSFAMMREKITGRLRRESDTKTNDNLFGDMWRSLDPRIPVLHVTDVNSQTVLDHLKEIRPDVILDHGTSLLKDHIIETGKLALNLHWGLSLYYRGSQS